MVRSSKWITGAKPEQPVTDVAQRALRERLNTVWFYAPLAAKKYEEDIEYVHQLRVATRRAGAGLQIFAEVLPKRETRWMREEAARTTTGGGRRAGPRCVGWAIAENREGEERKPLACCC